MAFDFFFVVVVLVLIAEWMLCEADARWSLGLGELGFVSDESRASGNRGL